MPHHLFKRHPVADVATSPFAATEQSLPAYEEPSAGKGTSSRTRVGPPSDVGGDRAGDSLPLPPDADVERRPTLSHIGRYALKGSLGSGGLGQVHEAWDPLLSRAVAVKTLHFDTDAASRAMLDSLHLAEARTARPCRRWHTARMARSSVRRTTWPRNSCAAVRSMRAPTCMRSARCSTSC